MYLIFKTNNKNFIWESDGLLQHFVNLRYFRSLIVEFIKTGSLSFFTWNIGLGMDLFSNFNYYIFGDIFSYISLIFPTNALESLYSVLIIVRMFCIGLCFIAYARYKKMKVFSTLIGSLMYVFSSYVLFAAVRHPYFANAVMLFPLLMIGIEKIILEDKKTFYIIIVALTFFSNFYFGYMMMLVLAIYGILLALFNYKGKKRFKVILKALLYGLLGILISSITLLPTIVDFLNSERSSSVVYPYDISYYRHLINNLINISGNYWVYWGVQSIILISLPVFIKKRKINYPLFYLLIILLLPLLFSNIGSIFNGFSYPNNRFAYVFTFIFAFITTTIFNENLKINENLNIILMFIMLYFGIDYLCDISMSLYTIIEFSLVILILLVLLNKNTIRKKIKRFKYPCEFIILMLFCLGICASMKGIYIDNGYTGQFLDNDSTEIYLATSNKSIYYFRDAVNYITDNDDSFYRISKYPYYYENLSLIEHYNSIGSYYSITPQIYQTLSIDLSNSDYFLVRGMNEFDYRSKITNLLSVKYQITNDSSNVPYGYTKIKEFDTTEIYENDHPIFFAQLYTKGISKKTFESLTPLEKETSLLRYNTSSKNLEEPDFSDITEVKYTLNDEYNLLNDKQIIVSKAEENHIKLEVPDISNKEVYVYIEGIKKTPFTKTELINLNIDEFTSVYDINHIKRSYKWYEESYDFTVSAIYNNKVSSSSIYNYKNSPYYFDKDSLLLNLGYYDNLSGTIRIDFSSLGIYTYDNIKIYTVDMDRYQEDIDNLNKSNFEVVSYGNGYLKGTVDAEESGVLQFSTFYNEGIKVYVDDKEVKTFKSNKYFLGINIDDKFHEIRLEYHNKYIKYGFILSIIGLLIFIIKKMTK